MARADDSAPRAETARAELTPTARSTSDARRFVADTLSRWQLRHLADTAALLTSEVVTNAVLHARTAVQVTITRTGPDEISVAVHDGSARLPRRRRHPVDATNGRGVDLLELLAATWAVTSDRTGKTVSFTLRGDVDPWAGVPQASWRDGRYG